LSVVLLPPALHSYTGGLGRVDLPGETLGAILAALEVRFPGIRFRVIDEQDRIRPHIRMFVDGADAFDLSHPVSAAGEVRIVCALSGG
jgi:molybdopterin converting factor small subunit